MSGHQKSVNGLKSTFFHGFQEWTSPQGPRRLRADHRDADQVGQLAAELPVSRSAVSQHLKILKDAGHRRRRGGPALK
jgi:DNA-binding transcriptional ArsR family regulator